MYRRMTCLSQARDHVTARYPICLVSKTFCVLYGTGSCVLTEALLDPKNAPFSRIVVPLLYSAPPLEPRLSCMIALPLRTVIEPSSVKIAPPSPPTPSPSS